MYIELIEHEVTINLISFHDEKVTYTHDHLSVNNQLGLQTMI